MNCACVSNAFCATFASMRQPMTVAAMPGRSTASTSASRLSRVPAEASEAGPSTSH